MLRLIFISAIFFLFSMMQAIAQPDLFYYFPEGIEFDEKIPTPKSVLGYEVGEFHVSHDKLIQYMNAVDAVSDRVTIEVTGYTHEARPLVLLTITSPENHANIENIRKDHIRLTDPSQSSTLNTEKMPGVFYLGCSIHGNEPSGSNAALLMVYYLAAAQNTQVQEALKNTIILLDPSFNPDGLQRFSTWVNSRKSKSISADPNDMEHQESWPTGRTNHYWFDLNRDWLVAQQPETQARVKKFHQWKPNLLTDHHEMSTNATFFFQPGVPSRMHPMTPAKNMELTKKIGIYHAKALDEIGSLYYTQEGFDDFYYGKGSSFPDIQGGIGLLFEQASSRGHAQESSNGILKFPFTIRNQFTTMLSSLAAMTDLRVELLNYQRQFYKDAQAEASKDPVKAFVFGSASDPVKAFNLAEIFSRQDIIIHKLSNNLAINGKNFSKENSYVIPFQQPQYRLIKSMIEKRTKFMDSIFYDISAWTLPLAAGVESEELKVLPAFGEKIEILKFPSGKLVNKSDYAYAFETNGYYAHRAINRLLHHGVTCKLSTSNFNHPNGKKFSRGSIVIPLNNQDKAGQLIDYVVNEIITLDGIEVYGFDTGLDYTGSSLGSNSFLPLRKPEIAMLIDGGISSTEAGELWHLLDTKFNIPATLIPLGIFNSASINRYNTIIFPAGSYGAISEPAKEKLKIWIQNGGIAIGFESALNWFTAAGLGKFDMKKNSFSDTTRTSKPYSHIESTKGAQVTSGAIFEVSADLTHPLMFGYTNERLAVFKGNNLFMEKSKNVFANPITYTNAPLVAGYISKQNMAKLRNASCAGVTVLGKGRIIGFTDNLAFRGFWFGTNKMLMNAIFYGHLINESSAR